MAESDDWVALLDAVRGATASAQIRGAFGQALAKFLEAIANKEKVTTLKAEQWKRAVVPLLAPAVEGTYAEGVARAAVKRPEAEYRRPSSPWSVTPSRNHGSSSGQTSSMGCYPIWSPNETPQDSHGSSMRSRTKMSAATLRRTRSMR